MYGWVCLNNLSAFFSPSYYFFTFCLDIDFGGILNLIAANVKRNADLIQNNIKIVELDFKAQKFNDTVESIIPDIEIVICADGN